MTLGLKDLLERVKDWPEEAQEELVAFGREIEVEITGKYHASKEELRGIDKGIKDADANKFATPAQMAHVFSMFRA